MTKKAQRIIIELHGGLVQTVFSETPLEVHIVDRDISGIEPSDSKDFSDYPVAKGRTERVYVHMTDAEVAPKYLKHALKVLWK